MKRVLMVFLGCIALVGCVHIGEPTSLSPSQLEFDRQQRRAMPPVNARVTKAEEARLRDRALLLFDTE